MLFLWILFLPSPLNKPVKKGALPIFNVLIVEDNQRLAANIGDYLEHRGHVVDFAMDGLTGLHLAVTQPFDIIILDIMLPGMDGNTLCRRLRKDTQISTPILMLTAKDTLDDKLEGFDAGADDYLIKPFELKELEARLHALVRRSHIKKDGILEIGDLSVDRGQYLVTKAGALIQLNRTCFSILVELIKAAPQVVTREELENILWKDYRPASDVLRSHIYTIRKKLDVPGHESFIETILGVGFRIRSDS